MSEYAEFQALLKNFRGRGFELLVKKKTGQFV